jgi:mono/diheme cytochrome c family protein
LLLVIGSGCKDGSPASTDPVVQGDELFRVACVRCHGAEGKGGPVGMLGEPAARDFTDPVFQARVSDDDIGRAIRNGRKGMPAFAAVFTPEQVNALTARVRRFGPARTAVTSAAASAPAGDASK